MNIDLYALMVGSLMYVMVSSRLDVPNTVVLSNFSLFYDKNIEQ